LRFGRKPIPKAGGQEYRIEVKGGPKMKRAMFVLTMLFVLNISAFAGMSTGQGGGMMGGGWGWGMNSGWLVVVIIAFIVILGIVYMMKRR